MLLSIIISFQKTVLVFKYFLEQYCSYSICIPVAFEMTRVIISFAILYPERQRELLYAVLYYTVPHQPVSSKKIQ